MGCMGEGYPMNKLKIRPIAVLSLIAILFFLVSGPKLLPMTIRGREPLEPLMPEKPKWTGIIYLWDIPFVTAGTGSHARWLNRYIRSFEKEYPGVYINVRSMTPERLTMYMQDEESQEFFPDIISLDPYGDLIHEGLLVDLSEYFTEEMISALHPAARDRVIADTRLIGVPWMMGPYCIIINNALTGHGVNGSLFGEPKDELTLGVEQLEQYALKSSFEKVSGKKKTAFYGFCTYSATFSKPLLSMIYHDNGKIVNDPLIDMLFKWQDKGTILPERWSEMQYAEAERLFISEKRIGMFLGTSHTIYSLKKKQEIGKGFDFTVVGIPTDGKVGLFTDQVAAYGLLKQSKPEKKELCVEFLEGMLDDVHQEYLREIGMFSVLYNTAKLYDELDPMSVLEESIEFYTMGPNGNRSQELMKALEILKDDNMIEGRKAFQ
jgi:multiple sugar transport system substrate-binding protein